MLDEMLEAAGRPACRRALRALRPQINYVLHGEPLAEGHDGLCAKSTLVASRHYMTADDLRKIEALTEEEWAERSKGGEKSAAWRALCGLPKVAPGRALTLAPFYAHICLQPRLHPRPAPRPRPFRPSTALAPAPSTAPPVALALSMTSAGTRRSAGTRW